MPEVFGVGGEHGEVVFQCGSCDERVTELHAVRQRQLLHQRNCALGDGRCDRQPLRIALSQALLHGQQFRPAAHALQQFEPGGGGNREPVELIKFLRGFGQATQMPDEHVCIDQHAQPSLREPSRL